MDGPRLMRVGLIIYEDAALQKTAIGLCRRRRLYTIQPASLLLIILNQSIVSLFIICLPYPLNPKKAAGASCK